MAEEVSTGSGGMTDLKGDKAALRKVIKERYKGQTSSSPVIARESDTAQELLIHRPEYKQAQHIGIYLAMPSAEVQTAAIIRDAFSNGKHVFVPYLYKPDDDCATKPVYMKRVMDLVELSSVQEFESLDRDKWGIPTLPAESIPARNNCLGHKGLSMKRSSGATASNVNEKRAPQARESALDLLIMPGVAFDSNCRRLGHGGGFYDNFLERCSNLQEGMIHAKWLIGLSLSGQMVEGVPTGDHDWRLDAVVVGDGRVIGRHGQVASPEEVLAPRDKQKD